MPVQEEITQLIQQLAETGGANAQQEAELILELLKKYTPGNIAGSKPYIERLSGLAKIISANTSAPANIQLANRYAAWAFFYDANNKYPSGQYDACLSQSQQALALFKQCADKEGLAKAHNLTGAVHQYNGNSAQAMDHHLLALKLREEIGDKRGIAASLNNIANIYFDSGNYVEAMKNDMQSLQIKTELGDKAGMANSYNNIGAIHEYQGNFTEALKNFLRALKIREAMGDKPGMAYPYNNIGNLYFSQGNYAEALKNQMKALQIREETGDKWGLSSSCNNIGIIYTEQGNYNGALEILLRGLHITEELADKKGIAQACNSLGVVYERQGLYQEAFKSLSRVLEVCRLIGDKRETAHAYICLGKVYEKLGDHAEAVKNKLLALHISEELGIKPAIKNSALSLFHSYKTVGDFETALNYYEKFHEVDNEIRGEQEQRHFTNLNFMHNLEQKEKELEIEQLRNVELKRERDRSENLLLNILPAEVANELKEKGKAQARLFDEVTVLFTDFKSFTIVSEKLSPQQLVDELHECFKAFDEIITRYDIEKIKTTGDAYMAASGLPVANANHAGNIVSAAVEIRDFMFNRRKELGERTFEVRIGAHTGSVVAGIVGVKKFAYDIWGDTVNTAARMEQNSEPGKINISHTTRELVKHTFNCVYRGAIEAKNKGKLKMYFVE